MTGSYVLLRWLWAALLGAGLAACVEPYALRAPQVVDLLVVEGTLTDLPEPQFVRLSVSKGDSLTGLPGTQPVDGAQVEVVVDSSQTVALRQTGAGIYQLPDGFRGRAGRRYQLRFQLRDGSRYASSVETLPAVPPILKVYDRFSPQRISTGPEGVLQAANEVFLDTQDPPGERNQYRWDWTLWERQEICHSCQNGQYYEYDASGKLVDGCIADPRVPGAFYETYFWDYRCKTHCWEILFSAQLNVFADTFTNGGPLTGWRVARIPFYQNTPALIEIRQSSLTAGAYRYYKLLDDQTQKTGGLADTPPAPLVGNVRNLTNEREVVVGYFTASAVATVRYSIDRRENTGATLGLFEALNQRKPRVEAGSPIRGRPPLTTCEPSTSRTPVKPEGWKD